MNPDFEVLRTLIFHACDCSFLTSTVIGCLHDPANVQHSHVYFECIC